MSAPVYAWDRKLIPSVGLGTRSRASGTPAFLDRAALSRERDELTVRVPSFGEREADLGPVIIEPGAEPVLDR
jgi:hypothetical protein